MFEKFEKTPFEKEKREKEEKKLTEEESVEIILSSESKEDRVNLNDFVDVYDEKVIRSDLNELDFYKKRIEENERRGSDAEKRIREKNKQRGLAFEMLMCDQAEFGEWFGENAMISRTSEYDDVINGIDIVVEVDGEKARRIALAVDASITSNKEVVRKKITKNLKKINNKKTSSEVKYFQSKVLGEEKGKIKNLFPVVVGAERKNANKLFELFAKMKEERIDAERKEFLQKELANHPLHYNFLEEIKVQLETYIKIFDDEEKKKECEDILLFVKEVIEEKEREGISLDNSLKEDLTYKNILEVCGELEKKEAKSS